MLLVLRLSLLPLFLAGCASELLVVPDSDWQTVPAAQRQAMDRQQDADLAAARSELTAARAGLAQPPPPRPPAAARPVATAPAPDASSDELEIAAYYREQANAAALTSAMTKVTAAADAVQRTDLAWRRARLAAAETRLDMVICAREVDRAKAIDHNLLGTDHYDAAPLRGQFSHAQQRWYAAAATARQARSAFERADAALASAKETYARVVRGGPLEAAVEPAPDEPIARRLTLPSWTITRSDIRCRRGLRHFLDDASNAPAQLRRVALQLKVRRVSAAPPSPGKPATTELMLPPDASVAAGRAGKPAATVVSDGPAAPATASAKPSAAAATSTKPAAPTAAVAESARKAAKPSLATGNSASEKPAVVPASSKQTTPARTNALAAKPVEAPPSAALGAKPVEP